MFALTNRCIDKYCSSFDIADLRNAINCFNYCNKANFWSFYDTIAPLLVHTAAHTTIYRFTVHTSAFTVGPPAAFDENIIDLLSGVDMGKIAC